LTYNNVILSLIKVKEEEIMIKVQLGATKILSDLTPTEKTVIKDELMLENPAYVQAQKFSIYNRIAIKKYLEYFVESNGYLSVPRGYHIPFDHEIVVDERFTLENVEYPEPLIKLRGTQQEALDAYLKSREEGKGVIVIPTGKGKSILGMYIAGYLKQRVLVIVHKDDLIDGWKKDAKVLYGLRPKQVGLVKADTFRLGRQIT
jgi:CRISPR/Cas system-associated endonuclease/helicase Cas3